jgi:hypothetical protein
MPYTAKQRALFNAAAEDPAIAEENGMTHEEAKKLAAEANKLPVKQEKKKKHVIYKNFD